MRMIQVQYRKEEKVFKPTSTSSPLSYGGGGGGGDDGFIGCLIGIVVLIGVLGIGFLIYKYIF